MQHYFGATTEKTFLSDLTVTGAFIHVVLPNLTNYITVNLGVIRDFADYKCQLLFYVFISFIYLFLYISFIFIFYSLSSFIYIFICTCSRSSICVLWRLLSANCAASFDQLGAARGWCARHSGAGKS